MPPREWPGVNDILEPLAAPCGRCLGTKQVTYCAAWGEYLCVNCRDLRNNTELRVPVAEHIAAIEKGRSTHVAMDLAYLEDAP